MSRFFVFQIFWKGLFTAELDLEYIFLEYAPEASRNSLSSNRAVYHTVVSISMSISQLEDKLL